MQGLERLNGITTGHYFSSSNKQKDYLTQLINKRNRLEISHFIIDLNWETWEDDFKKLNLYFFFGFFHF